jgi:formylglycine-generating enzyme required for sulfatase activity
MDPCELTCGQYRLLNNGKLRPQQGLADASDRHAVQLNFDEAIVIAERLGRRLPDEAEYELAATSGGARPFPWIDELETGPVTMPVQFGTVDDFPRDRVDLDPRIPIFGLCSNVAEWTVNWGVGPPTDQASAAVPSKSPGPYRVVRGGSSRVIEGDAVVSNDARDPRQRASCLRFTNRPGLGVRCVRSTKPRLSAADFVQTLSYPNASTVIAGDRHGAAEG